MPYAAKTCCLSSSDKYTAEINFKSERVGLKYLIKAVKGCDIKVITMEIPFFALPTNVQVQQNQTGTDVNL
jgi:hypothetical protein